jgi:hypothetical protein
MRSEWEVRERLEYLRRTANLEEALGNSDIAKRLRAVIGALEWVLREEVK